MTIEDVKLSQIQKITDMAMNGKEDKEIAEEMKVPVIQISNVRLFMGIRHRWAIDIRKDWKMIKTPAGVFQFNASDILRDMKLSLENKYKFMAISMDKKNKTITLKIEEAD